MTTAAHATIRQLAPDQLHALRTASPQSPQVIPRTHDLVTLGMMERDEAGTVWLTQLGRDVMRILRTNG